VVDQSALVTRVELAGAERLRQGIQNKVCLHVAADPPAYDEPREHIDNKGLIPKPLTCPGIFGPRVFRDNGSSNLRSSDEASEVYGRTNRSDIAGGRPGPCGVGGQVP
jgi:hypothetical protein